MDRLRKQQWMFSLAYVVAAALALYFFQAAIATPAPRRVSYSQFWSEVRAGRVTAVHVTEREFVGALKSDPSRRKRELIAATRLPGIDETALIKELEGRGVDLSGRIEVRSWWTELFLVWLLPLLVLGLIWGYGMRRMAQGAGPLSFGRNRAKIYDDSSRIEVTFADVAGIDEAKAELQEIVDFLKNPQKYQRLGGRIPKGVLLVGPPGTGKTLLARAVAGEAKVPFFSISGSEFVEMFVGLGAARVRDLFEQAKQKAPCIVFIDELDAIGKSRSAGRGLIMSHDEREQTLNQLLVEMDGFDSSKGVIIMGATNTPEVLDPALLRAGRFDRQVVIDRPDLQGREAILAVHARKLKLAPDVDLHKIAARTPGMVGADLANIANEAALLAARRGAERVEMRDFEEAIDRVMLGLEKKSRVMTDAEKRRVAYHEAGHALVALSLPHADPVHRLSIIPRTVGALGHMLQLPTQERYLMTRPQLEDQIAVMLGGRAAEDIVYDGEVSTGAADDLHRATELARQMVTRFGMSERLGHLTYGNPLASQFLKGPFQFEERNYSERTAEMIDDEVRAILDGLYAKVKRILATRRPDLERVVARLLEKETLDAQELRALVSAPVAASSPA
ncbi:MAG: ATP-dependent zinc metalloprotease FtsH [Bryobacterales bacterium]|nr:ATP-dependent zinc metalloprotease FtsH [Bryobacteraceae bacterium]MDW8353100.1 ATP-dependent zinc metalloprotease FtsH [Bryobacterales bacterium]